ncbi:hypothetical protein COU57_01185 [Candidatus Pacearchaeota archaeon CG10_big_fil_rev_8_21_14_0_10_32_14]|nr:MAG: hypothetical protein COU57_01185 [Candidatus Pacearchaeota archaeon CG10_big_fil_rev_8_21_14_0_10_32_14]
MKKAYMMIGMIMLLVVLMGAFLLSGNENKGVTGNSVNGEIVEAKLWVEGGNYVMTPSTFKKGQTVRLEADVSRMPGCSKGIVISEFKVQKVFTAGDNTVEFTPDKAGTFNIACSMNMYKGTFTVLEDDGTKSNYVQNSPTSGSSCGMGGGCGCGG